MLLFAILILVLGFLYGKINGESFQYISFPGLIYAVLKSLIVVLILLLAITATIPSFFIDLILFFITDYEFPLLKQIWEISWGQVTMGWFWTETSGSSLFFAALILLILGGVMTRGKR